MRLKAIIYANLFALSLVVVSSTFFKSEAGLSEFQLSRALSTLLIVMTFNCVTKNNPFKNFHDQKSSMVITRSFLNLAAFICFYLSLDMIGLGISILMFSLTPVWTSIMSSLNGEKVPKLDYFMITVCLVCVFGLDAFREDVETKDKTAGLFLALFGSIL
jgi:drug/metabolite transporter (DMT)-like permease